MIEPIVAPRVGSPSHRLRARPVTQAPEGKAPRTRHHAMFLVFHRAGLPSKVA
jgi:hypothetical protein